MYKWDSTKFHGSHWKDISVQKSFMAELISRVGIKNITTATISQHGVSHLVQKFGSLSKCLTALVPEYQKWCKDYVTKYAHELKLEKIEDLINVPPRYNLFFVSKLTLCRFWPEAHFLRQHDHSITKCTSLLCRLLCSTCYLLSRAELELYTQS